MDVEQYYNSITEKFINDYLTGNPRIEAAIRFVFHWLQGQENILDLGCGIGWSSHEFAANFPDSKVLGVDISDNSIYVANTIFNDLFNLSYKKADVTKEYFINENQYSAIVMLDIFEHIPKQERKALVAFLAKILKQQGYLILTCPSIYHQNYLRNENPSGLQPIDEDVTVEDLCKIARSLDGSVVYFQYVSIWNSNDYFHAVVQRNVLYKSIHADGGGGNLESLEKRKMRILNSPYKNLLCGELSNRINTIGERKNIAHIAFEENVFSETFIRNHKDYFNANVYFYFNDVTCLQNEGNLTLTKFEKILWYLKGFLRIKRLSKQDTAIVKSFRKHHIDKVYAEFGLNGVRIMSICKMLNIPLIVNFHGFDISINSILEGYKNSYDQLFEYAEFIVVVSKFMQKRIISMGASPEKIVWTPVGPDNRYYECKPAFSEDAFYTIGRFVDKKAPYYNILAFKKVLQKFPDAKLYLSGDGILLNVCKNIVDYFKLTENVIFLGIAGIDTIKEIFERVVALVQHSVIALNGDMEGTPVAILEAGAAGLPVISTRHAGIVDVVKEGITGLLVDEHDVDGMAKAMISLLENKEYAKSMGSAAREYIKANFSFDKHMNILNELLYR